MFQSFEATTRPAQGPPRLAALRAEMAAEGLDGFLVPRADAHQGEYVAPRDERLAWLTGFTGSAGFCAALSGQAGLFVDGRYRVQVRDQVDTGAFTLVDWPETKLGDWLNAALPEGGKIGFDQWLHSYDEVEKLNAALDESSAMLWPIDNLVDRIWEGRPPPPDGRITPYPVENAGETHDEKRARIAAVLRAAGQSAAILTLPDSICWLLNIRGQDIARVPVVQCFAILHADGRCDLFAGDGQQEGIAAHLGPQVRLFAQGTFVGALEALSGRVGVDGKSVPFLIPAVLEGAGATVEFAEDPCILPKARKNATEIAGARAAHLRDAAAMVEFLAWLDVTAPHGALTEIDVVTELEVCRRATNTLRDISFDTIAGSGPNGAIVHYRVTRDTNRKVTPGELLLIDSGGQYPDGTTDITRTVAVGTIGDEEKACFTRVLQGMIAISRLRFPKGLAGRDLDALARYPLWLAGQDYDHGTGHGVGAYLSVHEGPQRLSRLSEVALEPGMILSNEPGYYREGAFGIRIENLIVVEEAAPLAGADDREMLGFETLTWVPIDRRLIVAEMLSAGERAWLNAYHAAVSDRLRGALSTEARHWLEAACKPI